MIEQLKNILKQSDTIIFIGSGISLWSGLPSWKGLVKELASFVSSKGNDSSQILTEIERGDLLQAASYAFDKLTQQQIGYFIRQACRVGIAKPHEIHKIIISLGPKCFITTNYDKLVETTLSKETPEEYFRVVTNRQLAETAEIIGARSTNFIFKPHGDVDDSESIILTREQYRNLAPGGERNHALESLRILMASRPILYIGYSLRDPDFSYVRDLLLNTYKGCVRDHYAIMPDIPSNITDYWRRHYGIHILSYKTIHDSNKSANHTELLRILKQLKGKQQKNLPNSINNVLHSDQIILLLARHAARLSRINTPDILFPLNVTKQKKPNDPTQLPFDVFDGASIEKLLDTRSDSFIITGHPGAGKSIALKRSAARLAENLHNHCLSEASNTSKFVVPILIDLRLYKGDIENQIENSFPAGYHFTNLLSTFNVKIFLDGFNEIPNEYIESGSWEADFRKLLAYPKVSVTISSRTSDSISNLSLPIYKIDTIDNIFITSHIDSLGINPSDIEHREVLDILRRPLFFQLILSGTIKLSKNTQSKDLFNAVFENINREFQQKFSISLDIKPPLSAIAAKALDEGTEAFKLDIATKLFEEHILNADANIPNAQSIINWLISKSILLPFSENRAAFFHQTITEYLAALSFISKLQNDEEILREKLSIRRWDQSILFAITLLSNEQCADVINKISKIDFIFALKASKYVPIGKANIVKHLIQNVHSHIDTDFETYLQIASTLKDELSVSKCHEKYLIKIVKLGDAVGGAAASLLYSINKDKFKPYLLTLIASNYNDFNFCSEIARSLQENISEDDINFMATTADKIQKIHIIDHEDGYIGFSEACSLIFSSYDIDVILNAFYNKNVPINEQLVRLSILNDYIRDSASPRALQIAFDIFSAGYDNIIFSIYMLTRHDNYKTFFDYSFLTSRHIKKLLSKISNKKKGGWAIELLKDIIPARSDFYSIIKNKIKNHSYIFKAALLFILPGDHNQQIIDLICSTTNLSPKELSKEPIHLLSHLSINWHGNEKPFIQLLLIRNTTFVLGIIESTGFDYKNIGKIEFKSLNTIIDLLASVYGLKENWIISHRLIELFSNILSDKDKKRILYEYNKENSKNRIFLTDLIAQFDDITTDSLSRVAIDYLISELHTQVYDTSLEGHILGKIATDEFVISTLVPLLKTKSYTLQSNLVRVLRQAGDRHGKRYTIT